MGAEEIGQGPEDFVQRGLDGFGPEPRLVAADHDGIDPGLARAIEALEVGIEEIFLPEGGMDPVIVEAYTRLGSGRKFLDFGREYLSSKGITSGGPPHISYGRRRGR